MILIQLWYYVLALLGSVYSTPLLLPGKSTPEKPINFTALTLTNTATGNIIKCGATLIATNYLIVTASCLQESQIHSDIEDNEVEVVNGTTESPAAFYQQYTTSVEIIIHPKYDPNTHENDIAIIKVRDPFVFNEIVHPVCLPFKFIGTDFTGLSLMAVGIGVYKRLAFPVVQADLEVVSQEQGTSSIITYIPEDVACQAITPGGPILYEDPETGILYIVGMVSNGEVCATEDTPVANTFLLPLLDWIVENAPGAIFCE